MSEVPLRTTSMEEVADYSQVDLVGLRYKSVYFGAENVIVSPYWWAQIDWKSARTLRGYNPV